MFISIPLFLAGDKVTVSVSAFTTYFDVDHMPILDKKTITLGKTGGVVGLSLAKLGILQQRFELVPDVITEPRVLPEA